MQAYQHAAQQRERFHMAQYREKQSDLLGKVGDFPTSPGVYLMKDKNAQIIYVGKAKNLRARVRQYFGTQDKRYQIRFLLDRLVDIDFLQTYTEREALLLENSLIKKHKPRYNIFLKDDKSYLGLKITMQDGFPRVLTTRKIKKDGSLYYGPFTSAESLYEVKEFIDKYFQLRTCSDREFATRTRPCLEYQIKRCSAPCVSYVSAEQYAQQIQAVKLFLEGKNQSLQTTIQNHMVEAAGQEKFEEAARYRDLLNSMNAVLERQKVTALSFDFLDIIAVCREGDRIGVGVLMVREAQLIDSKYFISHSLEEDEEFLQNFMNQYYSENAFIPNEILIPYDIDIDLMQPLLQERAGKKITIRKPIKGEKVELLKLAYQNLASHFGKAKEEDLDRQQILENLRKELDLKQLPMRMECYDISNISGKHAVGSMVSFVEGKPYKDGYRRFKIKGLDTPNDFAMMHEVLSRRFRHNDGKWLRPNLIVIDGGKGQLNQAVLVLQELGIDDVEVVSIAKGKGEGARAKGLWDDKKEEEIYLPGRKNPVILRRGSYELMLLQKIRDEAHRFAITYHRLLRDKKLTQSWLDEVPGIGDKRKKELLKRFGSPKAIAEASIDALMQVSGITAEMAQALKIHATVALH